jgi:hypothetical protein
VKCLMEKWLPEKGKGLILLVIFFVPEFVFGQFLAKFDSVNYEVEIYLSDNAISPIVEIPIIFGRLKAFQLKDSTLYCLIESNLSQEEKSYHIFCFSLSEKGDYSGLYSFWFESEEFRPYEISVSLNEKGLSFEIGESSMWLIYSYGQIDGIRDYQNFISSLKRVVKINGELLGK